MFNVSALLLDDALKPATPLSLTNGTINQTLRQFAPLTGVVLQLVNCRELSTLINHLLKGPPKQPNQRDFSSSCLEAICQAQSTLIMQLVIVVAGVSACLTFQKV